MVRIDEKQVQMEASLNNQRKAYKYRSSVGCSNILQFINTVKKYKSNISHLYLGAKSKEKSVLVFIKGL